MTLSLFIHLVAFLQRPTSPSWGLCQFGQSGVVLGFPGNLELVLLVPLWQLLFQLGMNIGHCRAQRRFHGLHCRGLQRDILRGLVLVLL